MKWIKIEDPTKLREILPLEEPFLCLWKGYICIATYDQTVDRFFTPNEGSVYNPFSPALDFEILMTHYCKLIFPDGYKNLRHKPINKRFSDYLKGLKT